MMYMTSHSAGARRRCVKRVSLIRIKSIPGSRRGAEGELQGRESAGSTLRQVRAVVAQDQLDSPRGDGPDEVLDEVGKRNERLAAIACREVDVDGTHIEEGALRRRK